MKVHVTCQVYYGYDMEVPQEIIDNPEDLDLVEFCDSEDPVYPLLRDAFVKRNVDWDAEMLSITDDETGKKIWKF